jgi:hypothetical protein
MSDLSEHEVQVELITVALPTPIGMDHTPLAFGGAGIIRKLGTQS